MDEIEKYFETQFAKTHIPPSGTQLLIRAKDKRLRGVTSAKVYKFLRERATVIGPFAKARKVKHFQTIGVARPGMYFIDYGEFKKEWSWHNNGCTGFLVAVENCTNKLFVLATKGKDTRQWLDSIQTFVELTRDVRVLISDRDSVALSQRFRDEIQTKYGIKWHFLRKGNKSYLAERGIRTVKSLLSLAMLKASTKDTTNIIKRWVDFIPNLMDTYNSQKIKNTSYTRKAVHRDNFNHFLAQLLRCNESDLEMKFNGFKVSEFSNEDWNKKIFKFQLGDRVRINRKALWTNEGSEKHKGTFEKISMKGAYTTATFLVIGRQLRSTKLRNSLVPVYCLEGLGPYYNFYENELLRVE